jgi:hypothetical protein
VWYQLLLVNPVLFQFSLPGAASPAIRGRSPGAAGGPNLAGNIHAL